MTWQYSDDNLVEQTAIDLFFNQLAWGLQRQINNDNGLQTQWTNTTGYNSTYKKLRFSASYDSFVVNQTFVLRMNICGKNRQLLVAAKR